MSSVDFHKRVSGLNLEIQDIQGRIKEMEAQLSKLRKKATALRDQAAAIRDARAGIYDKWYRNHREDNSNYDTAWNFERAYMTHEGYKDGWQTIEGVMGMRTIFNQLCKELGENEGRKVFEWYCKTYNVTIADEAPASVRREVLGL